MQAAFGASLSQVFACASQFLQVVLPVKTSFKWFLKFFRINSPLTAAQARIDEFFRFE
jgi:hypothetical protein